MYGIEILTNEHDNVLRVTSIIRQMLAEILEDRASLDVEDMYSMIDIIRNYTDKHHHGKEEKILFHHMLEELGGVAEKIVRHGMLVEHDQARATVTDWETALGNYEKDQDINELVNIVGSAYKYAKLLEDHINRENNVVYTFAERELKPETLEIVDRESKEFERKAAETGIQEKYLKEIHRLESKYL